MSKNENSFEFIVIFGNNLKKNWNFKKNDKQAYLGWNYQDGKYALSVSLFVSFLRDLESKWAIWDPNRKYPVGKYTKESNVIGLFLL